MKSKAEKSHNETHGKTVKAVALQESENKNNLQMADNRDVSASQSKMQFMIDQSPSQATQRKRLKRSYDTPVLRQGVEEEELMQGKLIQRQPEEDEELVQGKFETVQRQGPEEEEELLQGKFKSGLAETVQAKSEGSENRTGMPDNLKAGLESLSGLSMDDVRVHYNSSKPAEINAHAFTQGKDIHVAPGQEKHLPHEGWHVVQQKAGRVKPTLKVKGMQINRNTHLEKEAVDKGKELSKKSIGSNANDNKDTLKLPKERGVGISEGPQAGTLTIQGEWIKGSILSRPEEWVEVIVVQRTPGSRFVKIKTKDGGKQIEVNVNELRETVPRSGAKVIARGTPPTEREARLKRIPTRQLGKGGGFTEREGEFKQGQIGTFLGSGSTHQAYDVGIRGWVFLSSDTHDISSEYLKRKKGAQQLPGALFPEISGLCDMDIIQKGVDGPQRKRGYLMEDMGDILKGGKGAIEYHHKKSWKTVRKQIVQWNDKPDKVSRLKRLRAGIGILLAAKRAIVDLQFWIADNGELILTDVQEGLTMATDEWMAEQYADLFDIYENVDRMIRREDVPTEEKKEAE